MQGHINYIIENIIMSKFFYLSDTFKSLYGLVTQAFQDQKFAGGMISL